MSRTRHSPAPSPAEWLANDDPPVVVESAYDLVTDAAQRATIPARIERREIAHQLAVAIKEIRQQTVGTQVAAAEAWGRAQSQVSRLEADPSVVQLGTLIDYVSALGAELQITFLAGEQVSRPSFAVSGCSA